MIISIWRFVTLSQECRIPKDEPVSWNGKAKRVQRSALPAPRAHVTGGDPGDSQE